MVYEQAMLPCVALQVRGQGSSEYMLLVVMPWFHFRFQAHNISMLYYEHPHSDSKFLDIDY
jgi:hypothetical protein